MRRLVIAVGVALAAMAAASSALGVDDPSLAPYAKPGIMADVGGGRRIHLNCMGKGSPTVILSAGAGSWAETWRQVQPAVAAKTRVCTWDRAGFGFSDPSPEPQDVLHTAADLEKALNGAKIPAPYVMVGHSLGGLETLIFTDRNRAKVAGVMLEDPSFPGQTDAIGAAYKTWDEASGRESAALAQLCIADAKAHKGEPETFGAGKCLTFPNTYPVELRAGLSAAFKNPARWETRKSFNDLLNADMQVSKNPGRSFGSIPLIVLTGTEIDPASSQAIPPAALAEFSTFYLNDWPKGHDRLAALSTKGQNRLIPGVPHNIHRAKPEVVIAAINEVVDQVRREFAKR